MAEDLPSPGQPMPKRPARAGEVCSCGRPAVEVVFTEDLGPVPSCGTREETHRPSDCPSWCVQDHYLPYDRRHQSENQLIHLDAYPWQECLGGKWRTFFQPLLVGLVQASGRPACIEIIGADDQLAAYLTAHEAEQLAEILRNLAATLRGNASR